MLAMTAMTLQELSNGRFVLGIGTSGPQVMEGWHGVRFSRPVTRTRETIEIVRMVTRGERLHYDGEVYRLPLPGGEGVALRSAAPPVEVPIYVASLGPANLRLTGDVYKRQVSADIGALEAVYHNNGFSKVKVTEETGALAAKSPAPGGKTPAIAPLTVLYRIDEGQQLRVGSVRLEDVYKRQP